jgi:hypothetical protein
MNKNKKESYFWTSYSDLMTSLFFIMLVLFVICIVKMANTNKALKVTLEDANATNEQLEKILQLDTLFYELSRSSSLKYMEDRKMFVAKEFEGIEIFQPNSTRLKPEFSDYKKIDEIGQTLESILQNLYKNNKDISYQLVIEGTAAIPWQQLRDRNYNPDRYDMYMLSYQRALVLYKRWVENGLNLRKYNTEIIIAGSGFNGMNRDERIEENNKRFIIQIIPKISRPDSK